MPVIAKIALSIILLLINYALYNSSSPPISLTKRRNIHIHAGSHKRIHFPFSYTRSQTIKLLLFINKYCYEY